jgi:hypothetical protein
VKKRGAMFDMHDMQTGKLLRSVNIHTATPVIEEEPMDADAEKDDDDQV